MIADSFVRLKNESSPIKIFCEDRIVYGNLGLLLVFSPFLRNLIGSLSSHKDVVLLLPEATAYTVEKIFEILSKGSCGVDENIEHFQDKIIKASDNLGISINFCEKENHPTDDISGNDISGATSENHDNQNE